jgi:hypothetical protein
MNEAPMLRCCVVHALPGDEALFELELPPGATVGAALAAAQARCGELDPKRAAAIDWTGPVGVFGEACGRDRALAAGDRVEIYRALRNDPKESRRRRARLARGPAPR